MTDDEKIEKAVLNYVEGWYSADSDRMDEALSRHLAKRRISEDDEITAVSKQWMVEETGKGRGRIAEPERGRKEIRILARTGTLASVELLSEDFVDYLHLVKIESGWKIANALWDFHGGRGA